MLLRPCVATARTLRVSAQRAVLPVLAVAFDGVAAAPWRITQPAATPRSLAPAPALLMHSTPLARQRAAGQWRSMTTQRRKLTGFPRFNNEVVAETVRLLDAAGEQVGVMAKPSAMAYCKERRLDLVQFSDMNEPVVCKAMDWHGEQRRVRQAQAERRRAQKREVAMQQEKKVKRMSFTARIEDHDLGVKAGKMRRMLKRGHALSFKITFSGPEAWRSQEEKRRVVLGKIMDLLGDDALWKPHAVKADSWSLNAEVDPLAKPTSQSVSAAAQMREMLRVPIWPAAVAKAEAARMAKAAATAGGAPVDQAQVPPPPVETDSDAEGGDGDAEGYLAGDAADADDAALGKP